MARSIWSGALSFGLVNIPVSLYPATQEHQVRFHQLERGTTSRVRYRRVNEDTGTDVPYDDIVKGVESDGGYVVLTDDEMEQAEPGGGHTIEISDFAAASEIDPIYFQKTYYLGPRDDAARKPYALLLRAIEDGGQIGIATFVLRSKQHLAAIRPYAGVLALETMHFADEVRQPEGVVDRPDTTAVRRRDLDMAKQLIETMSAPWQPDQYRDMYNDRIRELVEAKRRNESVSTEQEQPGAEIVDLTQALRASISRSRSGSGSRRSPETPPTDGADDPSQMTKTQLYDLAQQLGISGRSTMSRRSLEQAVTEADGDQRAQAS